MPKSTLCKDLMYIKMYIFWNFEKYKIPKIHSTESYGSHVQWVF